MPVSYVDHGDRSAAGRLPDALKPGIHRVSYYALDPGFHGVPISRLRTVTLSAARIAMLLSGN
jgi:hypothetical protein